MARKSLSKVGMVLVMVAVLALSVANGQNCGKKGDDRKCSGKNCCSKHGWCGTSKEHCGKGCQEDYGMCHGGGGGGGTSDEPSSAPCPETSDRESLEEEDKEESRSVPMRGNTTTTSWSDRSVNITHSDNWYNHPHCGRQARRKGEECDDGYCCSQHGFCGTTSDYCGDGCQAGCDNGNDADSPSPSY